MVLRYKLSVYMCHAQNMETPGMLIGQSTEFPSNGYGDYSYQIDDDSPSIGNLSNDQLTRTMIKINFGNIIANVFG